jgi:hypothetical protein
MNSKEIISVYDPRAEDYIYYRSDKKLHVNGKATSQGGLALSDALPRLPRGSKAVGRGEQPLGSIASTEPNTSGLPWFVPSLVLGLVLHWFTK